MADTVIGRHSPEFRIRDSVQGLRFSPTLAIHEQISRARRSGVQVLHMGFGQSPFPVHPMIRAALEASADKNMYLPSAGLEQLRGAALDYLGQKFGFDAAEFDAIVGPGSKPLIHACQLVVEGDLLLPVPSWVSYGPQAMLTNDHVIKIPATIADRYHITAESLARAIESSEREGFRPTKLIINYPNNPTGLTLSASRLEELAQTCRRYSILVISDEIYGLVSHRRNHLSIAHYYPEGTIVTSGLSKHLSLGGYRLGVALVPKRLTAVRDALVRVASETWSAVSAPVQFAAVTAFENNDDIEEYIQRCTRIHALVSSFVRDWLVGLGIEYPELDGAFYLYPDFGAFRAALGHRRGVETSEQLADDLLDTIQLAALPGTAFEDDPDRLRLRLAPCDFDGQAALAYYTANPGSTSESFVRGCCPNIRLACERLGEYLADLGP